MQQLNPFQKKSSVTCTTFTSTILMKKKAKSNDLIFFQASRLHFVFFIFCQVSDKLLSTDVTLLFCVPPSCPTWSLTEAKYGRPLPWSDNRRKLPVFLLSLKIAHDKMGIFLDAGSGLLLLQDTLSLVANRSLPTPQHGLVTIATTTGLGFCFKSESHPRLMGNFSAWFLAHLQFHCSHHTN